MTYRLFFIASSTAALLICGAVASSALAAQNYTALRPGLWEISTATRMQGMPYELPPVPYTTTQCLTQELLNNQENLAKVTATRGECDIHDAQVTETRTSWSMTCRQNGMQIDAKGSITPITQDIYTGNVHFTMHNATIKALNGVVNVQGSRMGDCINGNQGAYKAQPTYRMPIYPAK